jgi:hypothetical protein
MTRACLLTLVLRLGAQCAASSEATESPAADAQPPAAPAATPSPEGVQIAPPEFAGVDFANFAYPGSAGKRGDRLRSGGLQRGYREGGGESFLLRGVSYVVEAAGRKVVLKGREVFPFPQGSVLNHQPEISISDE